MEPIVKHVDRWRPYIKDVLQSKVDELQLLGYDGANEREVWDCLMQKVWRKKQEKQLHEVIQDVLHLKDGTYMNYLSIQAQAQGMESNDLAQQIEALNEWESNNK
ncbi:post-transcriptional regulator [Halalkalibacillus sediminis]|uniref:post-transcriptional regulator n=1 Tax=Halalkalibacillus sediminis TaxID=2018042 RepID=UPI001EE46E6C|nr:post-transcriptional regulator [Halalkalibacillus sediminis]